MAEIDDIILKINNFLRMIMNLREEQTFDYRGASVVKITGYDNGSFMLTAKDKTGSIVHYGMDNHGTVMHAFYGNPSFEAIMLTDGYYLCLKRGLGCHTGHSQRALVAMLCDEGGHVVLDGIYGFKVFTNGWYVLCFGAARALFNDRHQKVAEWFGRCFAFGDGYYATQSDWLITSLERSWQLFKYEKQLNPLFNVEAFVGTSCLLVRNRERKVLLTDLNGKELCRIPVVKHKKLLNNRFVLTFEDGSERLYQPDGKPMGVSVKDAMLLADGRFASKDRNLVTGLYGKDGIVEKNIPVPTAVYDFSLYYYMLKWFDKSVLYDCNGQNLGEGYRVIQASENFLLTERAGRVCLFNQFGCALVCDK
jgi:hypothetical protein